MKKLFIILFVWLAISPLNAQNKQEKIVKLLNLVQSEQMIDKGFDNMLQVMKQQTSKELNPEQGNELLTFSMSEIKIISKKMQNEDYPKIYDKYYTEKDIDKLIKFYKSQVGQKLLQVTPDIQKEFLQIMMNKYMPEFRQKVEEKKKQIKEQAK